MELKVTSVARITKVFGLKGAVCLEPLTDLEDRIYKSTEFFIDENCTKKLEVEKIEGDWFHLHVFFKNYNSIEKSKNLVGKLLYLPRIDSKILKENELFYYDLLEYKIEYLKDKYINASDIYIANKLIYLSLIIGDKEYLVPFTNNFIERIDKENHIIKLQRFESIEPNKISWSKKGDF